MKTLNARWLSGLLIFAAVTLSLSACGGSSGQTETNLNAAADNADAGDGQADVANPVQADQSLQNDQSPEVTESFGDFDIADLVVTEADRQWSCDVTTEQASSFTTLFFSRNGTVLFGENDLRFWNRNLPFEQFNIASPTAPFSVISDIQNFNTLLSFILTTDTGVSEIYDCVLTARETAV